MKGLIFLAKKIRKILRFLLKRVFLPIFFAVFAIFVIYTIILAINFREIAQSDDASYKNDIISDGLQIHMVDVGQGDGLVLTYKDNVIVIDAGTLIHKSAMKNYLDFIGVKRINALIITHPHQDHFGGLDMLLASYKVDKLYTVELSENVDMSITESLNLFQYNYLISEYNLFNKFSKIKSISNIKKKIVTLYFGELKLSFLSPLKYYDNFNNNSIVIRMDYRDVSALFTGDIEKQAEFDLVEKYGTEPNSLLDVDILKVAHHGSHTSTTQEFLDATSPDIALISCAIDNDFWHPHKPVSKRLEQMGLILYRTDEDGTIILETDGESIFTYNNEGDFKCGTQLASKKRKK